MCVYVCVCVCACVCVCKNRCGLDTNLGCRPYLYAPESRRRIASLHGYRLARAASLIIDCIDQRVCAYVCVCVRVYICTRQKVDAAQLRCTGIALPAQLRCAILDNRLH